MQNLMQARTADGLDEAASAQRRSARPSADLALPGDVPEPVAVAT